MGHAQIAIMMDMNDDSYDSIHSLSRCTVNEIYTS